MIWRPESDLEIGVLTTGATYTVSESMVIDASVVVGLSRESPDLMFRLGFTTNFGRPGCE